MNLRAITGFLDPGWPVEPKRIGELAAGMKAARDLLGEADYGVQSLRLATPPPAQMTHPVPPKERPDFARRLEAECFVHGLDYVCIGPALPEEPEGYQAIPAMLAGTENAFTSGLFADPEGGLALHAARACAQAIVETSAIGQNGFANLRLAGLANVAAGSPFFPAAYHRGGPPELALGTEGAELAVDALRDVSSLATARRRLVGMIEAHAAALTRLVQPIAAERELRFLGIDFSLAPFPDEFRSIGTALEGFGVPASGMAGTAAAAAFLADCLDEAQFRRTGFCGLFLSVMEDTTLAARAASGELTIDDLLLYSTLCGAGLDVIPLPGDVSADSLAALLIDLGALALRHNKPLTARLLPIPGKSAGDDVHFDFPYLADTRVMSLPASSLGGLLAGSGILDIGPKAV
jgi:hypothetical protein